MRLLIRWLISALGLWAASALVPGISLTGHATQEKVLTLLAVAVVFGLVNAVVKPVVKVVAFPFYLLTLGLLTFVVNGLLLWLTGTLSAHLGLEFDVSGFVAGFFGALVVSVVSLLANLLVSDD